MKTLYGIIQNARLKYIEIALLLRKEKETSLLFFHFIPTETFNPFRSILLL